jgi:hypothetical protein
MRWLSLASLTQAAALVGIAGLGIALARPAAAADLVNENLITTAPPGYGVGFQDKNGQRQIVEWVPTGETVDNWTEMVTVQIFYHLNATPDAFMHDLEKRWLASCPGSPAPHTIANVTENGYPSLVWLLDCPKNPATGKPEITWFKAVQGNDSFYIVQKAFRFAPSKEQITRWVGYLKAIHVCDSRLPDRPCPKSNE